MTSVANDFAFLRDHGMAALGACVKKSRHLVEGRRVFHHLSKFQKRWQGCDDCLVFRTFVVHATSLTRLFDGLNAVICPLIKDGGRFKLPLPAAFFPSSLNRLGRRQAVSHQILDLAFVGSNPTAPATRLAPLARGRPLGLTERASDPIKRGECPERGTAESNGLSFCFSRLCL